MSTVIKKGQTGRLVHRLASLDLADHLAEADKVLAGAQRRAGQLIERAKIESERLGRQAQEESYREGERKGRAEGRREGREKAFVEASERFERQQAELVSALGEAVRGLESGKQDLLIQANRDLLTFAVELANKVTHGVGRLESGMARANVEQVLRLVGRSSDVTVRINPQDADTLRQFAAELAEQVDRAGHVCIVEDAAVTPGGAVVEAGAMKIDAQVETQMEQLVAVLLGEDG